MEILLIIASGCIALLTTYFAGIPLSRFFQLKETIPTPVRLFIRMAIGFMVIPTAYSLWYTNGKTVFIGVLILMFAIAFLNRKEFSLIKWKLLLLELKTLSLGIVVLTGFVFLQFYRNGYFEDEIVFSSMKDFGVYTTAAEYLKITGVETSSPWYQLIDLSADGIPKIYHYEDLWFFSFVLDISNQSPLDSYIYIFTTVVATIIFFGYWAIGFAFNKVIPNHISWIFLSFALVIFSFKVDGIDWTNYFNVNVIQYPKIAAFPILLTLVIISKQYKIKFIDAMALGFLIIANVLIMPTAIGLAISIGIFSHYDYFDKNRALIPMAILCLFFLLLFHTIAGSFDNSSETLWPSNALRLVHLFLKVSAALSIKHFIFFLPVYISFLIIYLNRKKITYIYFRQLFSILFSALFFSSVITSIMAANTDSLLFASLTHTTLSGLMVLGCLYLWKIIVLQNKNYVLLSHTFIIIFILQVFYSVFATSYLQANKDNGVIKEFILNVQSNLKNKNKIGIGIANRNLINTYQADPRMCQFCNFLKQAGEGLWVNQIIIPEDVKDMRFKERAKAVELSPFYRYIQMLKKKDRFTTKVNAQVSFINQYDVDYAVVEKGAKIPKKIQDCTCEQITDRYSGTTVLIFNRPCQVD